MGFALDSFSRLKINRHTTPAGFQMEINKISVWVFFELHRIIEEDWFSEENHGNLNSIFGWPLAFDIIGLPWCLHICDVLSLWISTGLPLHFHHMPISKECYDINIFLCDGSGRGGVPNVRVAYKNRGHLEISNRKRFCIEGSKVVQNIPGHKESCLPCWN